MPGGVAPTTRRIGTEAIVLVAVAVEAEAAEDSVLDLARARSRSSTTRVPSERAIASSRAPSRLGRLEHPDELRAGADVTHEPPAGRHVEGERGARQVLAGDVQTVRGPAGPL